MDKTQMTGTIEVDISVFHVVYGPYGIPANLFGSIKKYRND